MENEHIQLPALIDRATRCLAEARSSAEVLEARAAAQAALHYAKVTKAANETQADCLRMIVRAEMRMANEIDRGQASGEVATREQHPHGLVLDADKPPATFDDLGLDRRRVAEWRETRDAGEAVVEQAIEVALSEGRAPTKADIHKHVRGTFGTGENEWYTPAEYLERARQVLGGIDMDPASSEFAQQRVKAIRYFTLANDGLKQKWAGRVWLNPPYAQPAIAQFVEKMVAEVESGRVSAGIMLTHNYTDTSWFHHAESACPALCFTRGRIRFESSDGILAAPTQGQAFFYYGSRPELFRDVFGEVGFVR